MTEFWKQHSHHGSLNDMLLEDAKAEQLSEAEVPEIMSMLPDLTGLDVLELGAGIG